MKLLLTNIISAMICLVAIEGKAQQFSGGGAISYNATLQTPGINLRSYYNVDHHLCFGPEITFFLPTTEIKEDEEITKTVREINFNAHYIIELSEHVGVYPIIGVNYTREREEILFFADGAREELTTDAVGLNIGAGIHVPLSSVIPFLEYQYVIGTFKEHIISAGAFYTFGKTSESHEE